MVEDVSLDVKQIKKSEEMKKKGKEKKKKNKNRFRIEGEPDLSLY